MAVCSAGGHLFNGDDAAFELFASLVLKLKGGVADLEMFAKDMIELDQDAGALRWGNVGDGDVACEGVGVRAEAPDMEVVHVDDSFASFHAGANLAERDSAGSAFEKNVERFAYDAEAGPKDESGDEERESRIDPVAAGVGNAGASGDHGRGGAGVSGHG